MTLQDFISSTNQTQLQLLGDLGKRVYLHASMEYTITLYRIDDFFVEVYFSRSRLCITHLRALSQAALPEYYHDEVDLAQPDEPSKDQPDVRPDTPGRPQPGESFFAWRPAQKK